MFILPSKLTPPIVLEVESVAALVEAPVKAPTNVVDVTEVRPAIVVALLPKLIAVLPTVTVELAKFALLIAAEPDR